MLLLPVDNAVLDPPSFMNVLLPLHRYLAPHLLPSFPHACDICTPTSSTSHPHSSICVFPSVWAGGRMESMELQIAVAYMQKRQTVFTCSRSHSCCCCSRPHE